MDAFIGEIKLWPVTRVPVNWALCNGGSLPIAQNAALYSLLGTYYGGDGVSTFNLPDLRGRVAVHGISGTQGGAESVTLTAATTPPHTHAVNVVAAIGNKTAGLGNHVAAPVSNTNPDDKPSLYAPDSSSKIPLSPQTVDSQGGSQAHNNMQPYLAMNYYICTRGIYPQRP